MVATGEVAQRQGVCANVPILIQGVELNVDFYVLPLGGCDAVLGVEWLETLDTISWHLKLQVMQFVLHGKQCTL